MHLPPIIGWLIGWLVFEWIGMGGLGSMNECPMVSGIPQVLKSGEIVAECHGERDIKIATCSHVETDTWAGNRKPLLS